MAFKNFELETHNTSLSRERGLLWLRHGLRNHWPCALEPTPSFDTIWCRFCSLKTFILSFLWVSRTGSASDGCALQEALYKCIDTIQYNFYQFQFMTFRAVNGYPCTRLTDRW